MAKKIDMFTQEIAPRMSREEMDRMTAEFLANGGVIQELLEPSKQIREKPSKGAIFLSDREERWKK